jgi:hypothetical protein
MSEGFVVKPPKNGSPKVIPACGRQAVPATKSNAKCKVQSANYSELCTFTFPP